MQKEGRTPGPLDYHSGWMQPFDWPELGYSLPLPGSLSIVESAMIECLDRGYPGGP
jgi:hypothetical protein